MSALSSFLQWAIVVTTCAASHTAAASGPLCAREICVREGSASFDEARCIAESPWIVEGKVQRVATATAMDRHPIADKMVMMTWVTGIYLTNTRMVKGVLPAEYEVGHEVIRIPYNRCGKRFEQEWAATGTRVRIYGRNASSTDPGVIVPRHNYVVTLPRND